MTRLYKSRRQSRRRRVMVACVLVLALALCVLGGLLFLEWRLASNGYSAWPREKFDPAIWRTLPEEGRYLLVRDLLDREILAGLTRTEVEALLGKPSAVDEEQISYVVKMGSSGFARVFVLDIVFDESPSGGSVVSYRIREN